MKGNQNLIVLCILGLLTLARACGDGSKDGDLNGKIPVDEEGDEDRNLSDGSSDSGGSNWDGRLEASCDRPCGDEQFCSYSGQCIDEGTCRVSADCTAGFACHNSICQIDDQCGTEEFKVQVVEPNLLILLDRSCSMPDCDTYGLQPLLNCGNLSNVDKWGTAVEAITQLIDRFQGQVQWGLEFFPDGKEEKCVQESPAVPPSLGTEDEIRQILTAALQVQDPNFPDGPCVTNINSAVKQISVEPSLKDPDRSNYMLLITDGVEWGCMGNNVDTENTLELMASEGVRTFVVGFGGGVNPNLLERFARAGDAENPDPNTDYYQADDILSLQEAFSSIVARIIGCDLLLDTLPENPDKIYVWVDDRISLARDHPDGWHYDQESNRIILQGTACEELQSGNEAYSDIDIVFGCNAPILE